MWRIKGSVGRGGSNSQADVKTIQALINVYQRQANSEPLGQIDGKSNDALIGLITEFQKNFLKVSRPDGRVDPNGRSWRGLHEVLRKSHKDGLAPVKPEKGIVTFESEGTEGGRYHSRVLHVPSQWSGVTIGRGYDMKSKSEAKINKELVKAGVPAKRAKLVAKASGLSGADAEKFIVDNDLLDFSITPLAQKELFLISYAEIEKRAKNVCNLPVVTEEFGECDWDGLNKKIREIVVDLTYRGDYIKATRKRVQPPVVENDLSAFKTVLADRSFWNTAPLSPVPADRFKRRNDFLAG